jgi:hypothetical protein
MNSKMFWRTQIKICFFALFAFLGCSRTPVSYNAAPTPPLPAPEPRQLREWSAQRFKIMNFSQLDIVISLDTSFSMQDRKERIKAQLVGALSGMTGTYPDLTVHIIGGDRDTCLPSSRDGSATCPTCSITAVPGARSRVFSDALSSCVDQHFKWVGGSVDSVLSAFRQGATRLPLRSESARVLLLSFSDADDMVHPANFDSLSAFMRQMGMLYSGRDNRPWTMVPFGSPPSALCSDFEVPVQNTMAQVAQILEQRHMRLCDDRAFYEIPSFARELMARPRIYTLWVPSDGTSFDAIELWAGTRQITCARVSQAGGVVMVEIPRGCSLPEGTEVELRYR